MLKAVHSNNPKTAIATKIAMLARIVARLLNRCSFMMDLSLLPIISDRCLQIADEGHRTAQEGSPGPRHSACIHATWTACIIWGNARMKKLLAMLLAGGVLVAATPVVFAQEVIDEYSAYISENDLYNSNGDRLREAWQIIRQDRANVHRYGLIDEDDEGDYFFDNADNRALLEMLVAQGALSRAASRAIVNGDIGIYVQVFGRGNRATHVSVEVYGG